MTRKDSLSRQTKVTVCVATLSLVGLMSPGMSQAQTTNITESGLNTRVTTSGTTTFIDGGTRPGTTSQPNLFHSFGDFSIGTGDTALFRAIDVVGKADIAYSGASIQNIIGRVTGTNPSSLFGTLDTISNFPTANLFLVNPNGMVFGANSTINVGGSANFVAGDYLKMTNGVTFSANAPLPTLSIAPVAAFGFLGTNPGGTISIQGGNGNGSPSLTLVGRDLMVGNTITPGIAVTGPLSGEVINLISVGQPADPIVGGEVANGVHFPSSGFGTSPGGNVLIAQPITATSGFTTVTPPTGTVTISRPGGCRLMAMGASTLRPARW